jgi:hypothetical protein
MEALIGADRLLHGPAGQRLADAAVLVREGRIPPTRPATDRCANRE